MKCKESGCDLAVYYDATGRCLHHEKQARGLLKAAARAHVAAKKTPAKKTAKPRKRAAKKTASDDGPHR